VGAHPLPDAGHEGLAAKHMSIGALSCELALDDSLRSNTSVVLPWDPERLLTAHPMVADHDVFDAGGQCMPQVQRTRHIGRWHAEDEWRTHGIGAWTKVAATLPPLIDTLLSGLRVVRFGDRVKTALCGSLDSRLGCPFAWGHGGTFRGRLVGGSP